MNTQEKHSALIDWVDIQERLPYDFQQVYVMTDCDDCPLLSAVYIKERGFHMSLLVQCDEHYDADEKMGNKLLRITPGYDMIENYQNRIIKWHPIYKD